MTLSCVPAAAARKSELKFSSTPTTTSSVCSACGKDDRKTVHLSSHGFDDVIIRHKVHGESSGTGSIRLGSSRLR